MSYVKRRISVYLCVLITFTTVFCAVQMENVYAAGSKPKLLWGYTAGYANEKTEDKVICQLAIGVNNLYVGDLVTYDEHFIVGLENVKYTSSNPSVIAINKKTGKIDAKKIGTSVITVKYKGMTRRRTFQVVKKSQIRHYSSTYHKYEKKIKKFVKVYNNGITNKNRYQLLNLIDTFDLYRNDFWEYEEGNSDIIKLVSPGGIHANALQDRVFKYIYDCKPFESKVKLKSLTAKSNKITITLNKKLTADNIYGLKYEAMLANDEGPVIKESNTVTLGITICDIKTGYTYQGKAKIKKGSGKVVIDMGKHQMKKGDKYYFSGYSSLECRWKDQGKDSINFFTAK